jgi:hypothetical protein
MRGVKVLLSGLALFFIELRGLFCGSLEGRVAEKV